MLTKLPISVGSGGLYYTSAKLHRKLTFLDRYGETFIAYSERGQYTLVPRNFCPTGSTDLRDEGIPVPFENHFQPQKPEQPRCIAESVALLREDKSHILCAPTGWGKTFVGAAIIAKIARRTLIITTKSDIVDQWIIALKSVLHLSDDQIGLIAGGVDTSAGKPVVVGLVHSVLKGPERFTKETYEGFGLVLVDECLAGDTPVRMADGTDKPLYAVQVGDEVVACDVGADGLRHFDTATVIRKWDKGMRKVLRITLEDGRVIRATPEHKFLLTDGSWIEARDLRPDHDLAELN